MLILIHWLRLRRTSGVRPVPEERPGPRPSPWRRDDVDPGETPPRSQRLQAKFGDAIRPVLPVFRADETVWVDRTAVIDVCRWLKDDESMNMLIDVCGVHTPDQPHIYEVVIHLYSLDRNERLRLKVALAPGEDMPSLTDIWVGANWMERETFDLVGVPFSGHPNLRRILLPDGFEGHPLHKDFPLKG